MLRSFVKQKVKHVLRSHGGAGLFVGAVAKSYAWQAMYYVYLIRSESDKARTYVGMTEDVNKRLRSHNEGANKYTSKFTPWKIECYIAFTERKQAAEFEQYLKHGSGHAFAKRRLWRQR